MVDEERVRYLLRRIVGDLADLEREDPSALAADPRGLRAVKYSFVTAIEAAIDVAQHLCASEGWGAPDTNASAFRLLADHGAIDHDLAAQLAAASGFRNVLVHDYAEVNDTIVIDRLTDLGDLRSFVQAIEGLLDTP